MKQLKKFMIMIVCAGVLCGLTACGNRNDADNGAVNNETSDNAGGTGTNDDYMYGATDGTANGSDTVGGALEDGADDVGDAVRDGVDDIEDGLDGDNNNNNTDKNTNKNR